MLKISFMKDQLLVNSFKKDYTNMLLGSFP